MTNLTLAIDDDLLKRARLRAVEDGTSVNDVVRAFLREYSGSVSTQAAAARRVTALARQHATRVGDLSWIRDDLHERGAT